MWKRYLGLLRRFKPKEICRRGQLLHVGCGPERLDGWVNIDLQPFPSVDFVADVTRGLPFQDSEALFAEHFLEHLTLEEGLDFLTAAHGALKPGSWLRLSTPNLEWVIATHYRKAAPREEKIRDAFRVNRAFYAWGHRFLWNRSLLAEALAGVGFTGIRWCRYGESELPVFRGIERHELYEDNATLPHVLIVEAQRDVPRPATLASLREAVIREFSQQPSIPPLAQGGDA